MSFRNNNDRLGAQGGSPAPSVSPDIEAAMAAAAAEPEQQSQQAFSFATPTEFVGLPSQGLFYPENHPLHGKDQLEIRFMTAKDEDILTSKSLMKKGLTIDRLLSNVIVDKHVKPENLLVGDRNALIVAARITGYGAEYKTKVMCPVCGFSSEPTFDLNVQKIVTGENPDIEGVETTGENTYVLELPSSKVKVEVKPLTGRDETRIAKVSSQKKKQGIGEAALTDQFRAFIVSVNGAKERHIIDSFINNMPASDSKYLRTTYVKCVPNIDLTQNFECAECAYETDMEVPFTTDFFWPK